jgi:hypothetical protein
MVIAIPAALLIEGDDKNIAGFEVFEAALRDGGVTFFEPQRVGSLGPAWWYGGAESHGATPW